MIKWTFVCYKNNELKGSRLIVEENGARFVEVDFDDLDYLKPYFKEYNKVEDKPIANMIKAGMELYITHFNAYLGHSTSEGPYCENEIFQVEYEGSGGDIYYRLDTINRNIVDNEPNVKKLIKVGDSYVKMHKNQ